MADADLGSVTIFASWSCPRESVLAFEGPSWFIHPLGVLQLKVPDAAERLPLAIALLLRHAERRFDAAIFRTLSNSTTGEK